MDPAQGETGGKSLTSKLKAKVPHPRVKDKVKHLKNRLPGMKKHAGGDDEAHEDSSEYDDNSPRGPGPETGYNAGESTPFSTVKTSPASHDSHAHSHSPPSYERTSPRDVQSRDYDSRPSQISPSGYDSQNRNYVAAAPPTRPAPMATDSPRSNLAPSLEDKFKYLDVGEKSPRVVNPPSNRSYQPEQQFSPSATKPQSDPVRSYQPEQQLPSSATNPQMDPIRGYQPEQQFSPSVTNSQTDPIRSDKPEQQYSPSTTESIQKGYSDIPRNSYRASPTTPANKGMLDKVKSSVTGAAVVLGDKMGYYNDTPAAPRDPNAPSILDKAKSSLGLYKPRDPNAPSIVDKTKATLGLDKPTDPNAPTMVEKAKATLGMDKPSDPTAPSILDKTKATLGMDKPRDPTAPSILDKTKATLGMDKPRDPNAPPLTEKAKAYMSVASQKTREYGASAADRAAWTKDRVAAQTTPTHHDKALSEQVTQTLSALPGAIRAKVFGPAAPTTNNPNSPKTPGVVDRVSGVMSSLFTTAPKQTAERLQHTFPAHSDYQGKPAPSSVPQNFADRSSAEERMPAASTPAYPPTYPMVNS
ncbi:hypothetical protein M758_1G229000 [Ceratodon purpureus]|nr:hypothetical protein M758_1G229000 [Ceratodon purpureus]